ncbi:prolipoprotein diacylglyceryl transferase [Undibacterium sp. TS12]|uniref:prolipoprotein diacylglyceryl transferase n=1 Tax=Undibacterium sp. TS12 TaxID=2908202 RepID=UPI001F4CACA3|nr:prolipoprotein diacylglyceryl transferase [Undibacterium sp. TS12]MCH8621084.1 prolipoprotein diacylglyceryl transferase [Undibacterium sp. TS12]
MAFPYLTDVVRSLFGISLPLPIPMFGLFVGIAMLVAAYALKRELQRKHSNGQIGTARMKRKNENGASTVMDVQPQEIVADLSFVVMLAGIAGARLFHILEHTDEFMINPMAMIFTTSGLSIFGGLIAGTLTGLYCVRRWRLALRPALDAAAPAMMLGYAIGRIGCQVSGDGDWGSVANLTLKPDWLPLWAWAQTYDNNIVGAVIAAPGVYPTPMYEVLMSLVCFALLWVFRKNRFQAGWLFSMYMLLAGIERLLIEKIRINPVFDVLGIHATQAEFISGVLIVAGLAGMLMLRKRSTATPVSGAMAN